MQFRNAKDRATVQPIDWALYSISASSVQWSGIHYGSDHPASYETSLEDFVGFAKNSEFVMPVPDQVRDDGSGIQQ
jgi:hypothetical protein